MNKTPSLELLIKNMDELYELADLLGCKTDISATQRKDLHSLGLSLLTGNIGIGAVGFMPGASLLSAVSTIFGRQRRVDAKKRVEESLLPLYQEISVKVEEENLRLKEERNELARLLQEAQRINADNQKHIAMLTQRIEQGEMIIAKYNALFTMG